MESDNAKWLLVNTGTLEIIAPIHSCRKEWKRMHIIGNRYGLSFSKFAVVRKSDWADIKKSLQAARNGL